MNNNISFFDGVIKPVLVIIGFLIGVGIALSANGDVLTEFNVTDKVKTAITPNIVYADEYDTIIKDSSTIKSLEDKISRLESVINQDNRLRKLYHGGIPTYTYETNLVEETVQRIDKYPDGYIYIEKGQKRPLITPEKLAKMEVARKNLKIDRINSLKQRIETLSKSTNAVDFAKLDKCKRLLERLERSSTTNTVDIIVKPQTKE
jgi:type VI protein secretion system component VasK